MLLNELWMVLLTASAVAALLALVPVTHTATPQQVSDAGDSDSTSPLTSF